MGAATPAASGSDGAIGIVLPPSGCRLGTRVAHPQRGALSYQYPAVTHAVVIAVPDAYHGQAPKAFVVLRSGHEATPDALREHLAGM